MSAKEASQQTVRREVTKDKAGALSPDVYAVYRIDIESEEKFRFPEESNVSSAI